MEPYDEPLTNRAFICVNCPIKQYSTYIISAPSTGNKSEEKFISLYVFDLSSKDSPSNTYIYISIYFLI
jgi:hypothetical protein